MLLEIDRVQFIIEVKISETRTRPVQREERMDLEVHHVGRSLLNSVEGGQGG